MNPSRFGILFIFIYFSFIHLSFNSVWPENYPITPTYDNQTYLSVPSILSNRSVEERLDILEARMNDLAQKTKTPPKDPWDKLGTLSILISGIIVAFISGYVTNRYQASQREVMKIQTVQGFMPHLSSPNLAIVKGSLNSLALLDPRIALSLADTFYQTGGLDVLYDWTYNPKMKIEANKILWTRMGLLSYAMKLLDDGWSPKDIKENARKYYTERGQERGQERAEIETEIEKSLRGIDLWLSYQKPKPK
jgi:hypothetical protein